MTSAFRRALLLAPLLSLATAAGAARWEAMPGTNTTMEIAIDRARDFLRIGRR